MYLYMDFHVSFQVASLRIASPTAYIGTLKGLLTQMHKMMTLETSASIEGLRTYFALERSNQIEEINININLLKFQMPSEMVR